MTAPFQRPIKTASTSSAGTKLRRIFNTLIGFLDNSLIVEEVLQNAEHFAILSGCYPEIAISG
jgi:hypothetical protein